MFESKTTMIRVIRHGRDETQSVTIIPIRNSTGNRERFTNVLIREPRYESKLFRGAQNKTAICVLKHRLLGTHRLR